MTRITVIIVTYNAMPWIERCLASVAAQGADIRTVVIDNASTDDTVAYIQARHPAIHLIESKENLGFGKANNIGIHYALQHGTQSLMLLNQDAYMSTGMLETLSAVAARHPEYAIISPIQTNGAGDGFDGHFGAIIARAKGWNFEDYKRLRADGKFDTEIFPVPFVMAAMWFMPAAAVRVIGSFDPLFGHYGEDNDLALRAAYHGYKVGVCPLTTGAHDREMRRTTDEKKLYVNYTGYLCRLKDINRGWAACLFGVLYKAFGKWVKLALCGKFRLAWLQWGHTWRTICQIPRIRRSRKACIKQGAFLSE